jgi:hypothetical protein
MILRPHCPGAAQLGVERVDGIRRLAPCRRSELRVGRRGGTARINANTPAGTVIVSAVAINSSTRVKTPRCIEQTRVSWSGAPIAASDAESQSPRTALEPERLRGDGPRDRGNHEHLDGNGGQRTIAAGLIDSATNAPSSLALHQRRRRPRGPQRRGNSEIPSW